MKLNELCQLWERDGFDLIEQAERINKGHKWYLYSAYDKQGGTLDYGRHFALLMAVDPNSKEIIAHDMTNMRDSTKPTLDTMMWFAKHVEAGV